MMLLRMEGCLWFATSRSSWFPSFYFMLWSHLIRHVGSTRRGAPKENSAFTGKEHKWLIHQYLSCLHPRGNKIAQIFVEFIVYDVMGHFEFQDVHHVTPNFPTTWALNVIWSLFWWQYPHLSCKKLKFSRSSGWWPSWISKWLPWTNPLLLH